MPIYKLNHDYESYRDGRRYGPWQAGDTVVLDETDAEWVDRDSAGALTVVKEARPNAAQPEPAAGARPRVGGDPDLAEAAARAKERVDAESRARQDLEDEDDSNQRQQRPVPNRQQRGGRNR